MRRGLVEARINRGWLALVKARISLGFALAGVYHVVAATCGGPSPGRGGTRLDSGFAFSTAKAMGHLAMGIP